MLACSLQIEIIFEWTQNKNSSPKCYFDVIFNNCKNEVFFIFLKYFMKSASNLDYKNNLRLLINLKWTI